MDKQAKKKEEERKNVGLATGGIVTNTNPYTGMPKYFNATSSSTFAALQASNFGSSSPAFSTSTLKVRQRPTAFTIKDEGVKNSEPIVAFRAWTLVNLGDEVLYTNYINLFTGGLSRISPLHDAKLLFDQLPEDKWRLAPAGAGGPEPWGPVEKARCMHQIVNVATCSTDGYSQEIRLHVVPDEECTCGLYGLKVPEFKTYDEIKYYMDYRIPPDSYGFVSLANYPGVELFCQAHYHRASSYITIIGYVNMWGNIIEHDMGYRAEYAQVKSIVIVPDLLPEKIIEQLITTYECEVIR